MILIHLKVGHSWTRVPTKGEAQSHDFYFELNYVYNEVRNPSLLRTGTGKQQKYLKQQNRESHGFLIVFHLLW